MQRTRVKNAWGLNEPDIRKVTVWIYGLEDPRTGEIRYVGRSANPEGRMAGHCSVSAARAVYDWTSELRQLGLKPILRFLLQVKPGEDAARAEGDEILRRPGLLNDRRPNGRLPKKPNGKAA